MPIQQLPLMRGTGKDYRNVDYVDLLPVNIIATPKEIFESSGYMRSIPGIVKKSDVDGVSRGVEYNTAEDIVYRVAGGKIYKGTVERGAVTGVNRVSMSHGRTSQAVCSDGSITEYRYDGTNKTVANWPVDSGYLQYELGYARDLTRLRGRYVWSKDNSDSWFISDLEDESHPDRYSAEYRAESQPDGIIGIDNWRDFVVCFGSSTIEFFYPTGGAGGIGTALFQVQPSLMVQKGIAGTYCKTKFSDSHAFISHPATGAPSIYVINSGAAQQIATATIEKILQSYTFDELAKGVMETTRFESHELLIVHLARHVLVFDAAASQAGAQWTILKTGLHNDTYRGIDFSCEGNVVTCGDKISGVTGYLDKKVFSQYGEQQEGILYTPMFSADNRRIFDLELDSSDGLSQSAEQMFVSAATDGINYGLERMIPWAAPFIYDSRVILKRVGRVRKGIAFKFRIVTSTPITLSNCQVRIE